MDTSAPSFRKTIREGFSAFRIALFPILIFEIIYKTILAFAIRPLFSLLLQIFLQISGAKVAFNADIWKFVLSVPGVLAAAILFILSVLLTYFEFSVIIVLAQQIIQQGKSTIKSSIIYALGTYSSLKGPGVILFAFYSLLLLPLVNMGLTSSLLPQLSIPNFIVGEVVKMSIGPWALLGFFLLVIFLFFCLVFILPSMVLERSRFIPAAKKSIHAIKIYKFKVFGLLLLFAAAWLILFFLPRQIFNFFFGTTSITFWQALTQSGFSLRTPIIVLVWLAASFAQIILMPLLLVLLTACYLPLSHSPQPNTETITKIETRFNKATGWLQKAAFAISHFFRSAVSTFLHKPFVQKHKKLLAVLLMLLLVSTIAGAFFTTSGIHDPIVIGHRGSGYAVENTLEAIQYAIDTGADYAEIDILLSADGIPMVIHDTNLQRLTGQDVNVYELTAAQLQKLTLHQNGQTGHISTLEEVVAYCEGKILLAVEYKLHGHEQVDLVRQVMQIMSQSVFQKNSIYLSLNYELVAQMKEQYPNYRTGYCVYGNVGQLTPKRLRDMNIDFLLVEEWMASKKLVDTCRKAWLPVYVWTANDSETIDDYLQMGITGIVTDYPDMALEVVSTMYNLDDRITIPL